MKKILLLTILISGLAFGQIDYKEVQTFVGKPLSEFNDFYKIKPSKVEDNFGDQKIQYSNPKIYNYDLLLIDTNVKDGKITDISLTTDKDYKMFFKNTSEFIQSNTPNDKLYIVTRRDINGKESFFPTVEKLIDAIKSYVDLKYYTGIVTSFSLNMECYIFEGASFIVIKNSK